jgi:hypothetical protein
MGISLQEYLRNREACSICLEDGHAEHCITTLLSRLDTCLIYNAIEHNNDPWDNADGLLLRRLRVTMSEEQVVDYYIRSEALVRKIKDIHGNSVPYWTAFYKKYVYDIVVALRGNDILTAVNKIYTMLIKLENTEIVIEVL